MKKGMITVAAIASLWFASPASALAQGSEVAEQTSDPVSVSPDAKPRRLTVGFNIDLFPIIASATQGAFGFAGQLQLAIDQVQFRLVGAKLRNFSFFLDDDFEDYDTVVLAFLLDFFFREDLSGFWVSSGFELWLNEIGNANADTRVTWTTGVWTLGGGYVWRIGPHFFVNPWIGMHVRMNNPTIELGGQTFQPLWVVANASIKLGAYFDL